MSDSETSSSDIKVKYQNSRGDNLLEEKKNDKKPLSSDTDFYFNMIANPNKVIDKTNNKHNSDTSELNEMMKKTDSESSKSDSSSKSSLDSSSKNRSSESSSKNRSSESSSKNRSSESRAKYEQINMSKNNNDTPLPTQINTNRTETRSQESQPIQVNRQLSPQELNQKKIEMIRRLSELKQKGYQLTKDYDWNSSLEEMEYEYELLKSFADKRNGLKLFKNGLLQAVSVIEFLNDKYDPFDFHLTGWGEHVQVEIDSWEDVLEELYEKYKGTGKKMAPEIKLLYLIIASASAFHFTKSQSSKLPGLDSVLASNPGLLSKIIQGNKQESSQFMTAQELNIEKQKEELKRKDMEKQRMQQQFMQQQQQQMQELQEQLRNQQEQINTQKIMSDNLPNSRFEPMPSNYKPSTININELRNNNRSPDIRAPDQVKDILSRIHNIQPSTLRPTDTQDETSSNNDRLISEANYSENNPKRRQNRKPIKKANISIE